MGKKYRTFLVKDWQYFFFFQKKFLVYPILTNFTQRKRKTYGVNDLLVLSIISIIVYLFSWKKYYFTHLKTTA